MNSPAPTSSPATTSVEEPGIAILGMGCRFPGGADDPEAFWRLIHDGTDATVEIPPERWDTDRYYAPERQPGKMYTRRGGFVPRIFDFDARFFGISGSEARNLDPQQRLLLEVSWEALEDAGISPDSLAGSRTGVFIGTSGGEFLFTHGAALGFGGVGGMASVAAGRIAYHLDLRGPALSVDTACSSSMVALHMACESLRRGECDLALVGGVNTIQFPAIYLMLCDIGALSPDGRCKSFSAAADGFARAEGCGMLVVGRPGTAQGRTRALVRATALNHDGHSSTLIAPNTEAQAALLRDILDNARLKPEDITYIEAHGTGTPMGDPIEFGALREVLGGARAQLLRVGAVKSNVGHLEAAAGMASLIKAVLSIEHAELAPNLHVDRVNPRIELAGAGSAILTERVPWQKPPRGPRMVSISSFGFAGTNAQAILEEPPEDSMASPLPPRSRHLLCLSARSDTALAEMANRYQRHLRERPSIDLADLCFTAAAGRSHFEHRAALVLESREQALAALGRCARGETAEELARGKRTSDQPQPKVAFLFTGQGAQYAGMGRRLYAEEPVFREALDACEQGLREKLPRALLEVMFGGGDEAAIHQTLYAQPALFSLQYGLCRLWDSWGVRPVAVLGHSVGEFAAACAAGVLQLNDALALISARGRLMQALPQNGAMVSVQAPVEAVSQALASASGAVSIAAINGPRSTVLSGEREALQAVAGTLEGSGFKVQQLSVSHAFHSALMEPMLEEFERTARAVQAGEARCKLISNLTGQPFAQGQAPDALYWRRHVREPVLFERGMRSLADSGISLFLEIGPQPTLTAMSRSLLANPHGDGDEQTWLWSLSRETDDTRRMMESAAALYAHGVELDWKRLCERRPASKVLLPTYPFERKRHWIPPATARQHQDSKVARGHPLLGRRLTSPLPGAQFEGLLGAESPSYLAGHRIYGLTVFPATGYVELALAAMRALVGERPCELENVSIERALILPEDGHRRVQVLLSPVSSENGEERFRFEIHSQPVQGDGAEEQVLPWLLHARGEARCNTTDQSLPPPPHESAASLEARFSSEDELVPVDFYRVLTSRGMGYTGAFQPLTAIRRGPHGSGFAFARAVLPSEESARSLPPSARHVIHPALLDGCLQAIGAALTTRFAASNAINMAYLPVAIERVCLRRSPGNEVSSFVEVQLGKGLDYSATLSVFAADGLPALEIKGLRMQGVERSRLRQATSERQHGADILHQLSEASPAERWGLMVSFLATQVADIMGIESSEIDGGLMYFELGMSSLSSVELQYRLQKNLRCELPKNLIVDYESTESLAVHLLTQAFGQNSFERGQP